ncbi:MAG: hypothetical protein LBH40_03880 [Alphaproteobacteria bacterium]|jgi:hypothetical protein|nr:hypothetical protein [Alphaproteobacteria bacterium]
MSNFNLYPYLASIKENLKIINRGEGDCLNYIDTKNNQWQRVLQSGNILTLILTIRKRKDKIL